MNRLTRRIMIDVVSLVAGIALSTVIIFALLSLLPGNPAQVALGVNATPEQVAALSRQLGTDRSPVARYVSWVSGLLTGNWGVSAASAVPAGPIIAHSLAVTAWLVGLSTVLTVVIAAPVGLLAAYVARTKTGIVLSVISQIGLAIPSFVFGVVVIVIFSVWLRWLPSSGWVSPTTNFGDFVRHAILPVVSLTAVQCATLIRYVRSAAMDVLRSDFVRTAHGKGLGGFTIMRRHVVRNTATSVVTAAAIQATALLVGAIVVERVFNIPGLGSLLLVSVGTRDMIVVQDIVVILVAAVLIANVVADLVMVALDPRLRRSR